ncbi:MAG: glycosyltransferase [Thermoleophilaceae bacterium]
MRILVFHAFLLRGTGSNIYNAGLAQALVRLGHEVHLFCQDTGAARLPWVDAVGTWRDGRLELERLREPVRCTAYLPDTAGLLPVYVADEYEGFRAVPYPDLRDDEIEAYVEANAAAVRDVVAAAAPEVALANHLVMGPAVLARAGGVAYAVKVHGSALEYTVRRHRERFLPWARQGLAGAGAVLVGSRHTAESLWEVMDEPGLPARTRLGPPGVDVHAFLPRPPAEAAERVRALAGRLEGATGGWGGDAGASDALRSLDPERDLVVSYVGKLIVSKGVDLLVAAWPLVAAEVPAARLCIVGFGTYRPGLERLVAALAAGDRAAAREVAARGRELEGGPAGELSYLAAFLDGPGAGDAYLRAAPAAFERVAFTGRLEHGDLPDLLPGCAAQVVPSTFPEAFGMVAAEAACCGALPLSAAHSGLAEVTARLAPALRVPLRDLLAFEPGPGAVEEIAAKLVRWLRLGADERSEAAAALSAAARELFGWEQVADGVIAAARGRLDGLPEVEPAGASLRPASG